MESIKSAVPEKLSFKLTYNRQERTVSIERPVTLIKLKMHAAIAFSIDMTMMILSKAHTVSKLYMIVMFDREEMTTGCNILITLAECATCLHSLHLSRCSGDH